MIDNRAVIASDAKIGNNVTISPFAVIEEDVIIGDNCKIGSFATIGRGTRLDSNVTIFNGAAVGTAPQDLKYRNEDTKLFIGSGTTVREFATINRGTTYLNKTVVGKNCLIMAYAHVAHDCVVGKHAMIGGGYRVTKDVPPFITVQGEPLKYVGINSIGLKRRGFSDELIESISDAYRVLLSKKGNISQNLELLKEKNELEKIAEVADIILFTEKSERGIVTR